MIYFYRLFYSFFKNLLVLLKVILPQNLKAWVDLRTKKIENTSKFTNAYWFHASSGEIEYCKSVIRLLKEQQPSSQIVVTYSSPSAEKLFHNITAFVDQFIPLPWDQADYLNSLIDYLNPKVLIFARTDLWPELILQVKKRNIQIGVISFNPQFSIINSLLNNWLLPQIDFISCIDDSIKNKLSANHKLKNITNDGDTRFDQVFHRLQLEPKIKIISEAKILVCGSTWPEDENILFECFSELIRNNFKIILSPHEVNDQNIIRLQEKLSRQSLSYQLLSKENNFLQIVLNENILIIDKIGYLADAYRYAHIAFVGGSFKEKVHSVMEPLCCGLPVMTGPYYKNNPEAIKYQNKFVFTAITPEEVIQTTHRLLAISKSDIITEMKKNMNASQKVLHLLFKCLNLLKTGST